MKQKISTKTWVTLLVDWKNIHHLLTRSFPSTTSTPSNSATAALHNLRHFIKILTSNASRLFTIDTMLFGGFTDGSGQETSEAVNIHQAEADVVWRGVISKTCKLRDLHVITGLPRTHSNPLPGLYRPNEKIRSAFLNPSQENCDCKWRKQTLSWLTNHHFGSRKCPACLEKGIANFANLCQHQQKLVDALLTAFAFDTARNYLDLEEDEHGEIWICSSDADFVPALMTIRKWGLHVRWLQPVSNTRFGYSELLKKYGVEIVPMNKTLEPERRALNV